MTETPSTVLDAALWMAREIGAYVFPVDHPDLPRCAGIPTREHDPATCVKRGKHPCVRFSIDATTTERDIFAVFSAATRNYGVETRRSRLLVLDVDDPASLARFLTERGEVLAETFEVSTGRGRHLYYNGLPLDGQIGNGDLCPGVNVRAGSHGYVVGPASKHATGATYTATWDRRPAPAPGWLVDFLLAKATANTAPVVAGQPLDRTLPARVRELLDEPPGDRSERFHRLIGELRAAGLTQGQAVTVLTPWCARHQKYLGRVPAEVARCWDKVSAPADGEEERAAREVSALARELAEQRVRRQARRILDAEERPAPQPPEVLTLRQRLARPRTPTRYRIEGWQPAGTRVVLAAQYKSGKTTAAGNLARCLIDGDPWLGRYKVDPIDGTLVLLDFEMSPAQLEDWLADQRIVGDDRVIPIPLRGNAAAFDILDPARRSEWATQLRRLGAAYLMLDPLRPVLDALGLDEKADAGRFLVPFDALLADAGINEALVIHHMGHTGERSRGDSRIRDWPDVEWRLVRQDDDPASARFISAYGRDVDMAESQLEYDRTTRHLTIVGGTRKNAAATAALPDVLDLLDREPALSGRAIEDRTAAATEHTRSAVREAIKLGIREGTIRTETGPRRAVLHFQCASAPQCAASAPAHSSECASAPIEGALHSDTATGAVRQPAQRLCHACNGPLDPTLHDNTHPTCEAKK